ncbi:MAG: sigma factor, partial [Planctomycetota bacterium]
MKTEEELSIDQIWEQFHKTHDDRFRNLLLEHYRNLVRYCAERLHSKLPDKVELDDLTSAGFFGLKDAIDAFDP